MIEPELCAHVTTDASRPVLVWRLRSPLLAISSAPVGGGLGERRWVVNAQVPLDYDRVDIDGHLAEIAGELGCAGEGVGMLTAARYEAPSSVEDGGVRCWTTVGVTKPTWAASDDDGFTAWRPGTINTVVLIPVRLSDAALVNAVVTATESKVQALAEHGVPGTGTASDAVCLLCPLDGASEPFAGPRSEWGSRLARAVHASVTGGLP